MLSNFTVLVRVIVLPARQCYGACPRRHVGQSQASLESHQLEVGVSKLLVVFSLHICTRSFQGEGDGSVLGDSTDRAPKEP